jgi:hypothetical protein
VSNRTQQSTSKRIAKHRSARREKRIARAQVQVAFGETLESRVLLAVLPLGPLQGGTPDYYGPVSNWANSPQPTVDPVTGAITGGIVKFADSLPGLYFPADTQIQRDINMAAADNNLGQYIPVAWADTTTYLGSDYYEIALVQYTEQMSSSLNPTTLRGYVQVETLVNGTPKLLTTDPTWPLAIDDARNDLWTGHVYMPNQNPNSADGANPVGRWDYGPFFWPRGPLRTSR